MGEFLARPHLGDIPAHAAAVTATAEVTTYMRRPRATLWLLLSGIFACGDPGPGVPGVVDLNDSTCVTVGYPEDEIEAVVLAHSDCSVDEDCVYLDASDECMSRCRVVINRSFMAEAASELELISSRTCLSGSGCRPKSGVLCYEGWVPFCNSGMCIERVL